MGHKYVFGTEEIFEGENDQYWNHMQAEVPAHHLGYTAPATFPATEDGFHPMDTSPIERVNHASAWVPPAISNGHSSSSHVGVPHNPSEASGPRDSLHHFPPLSVHMVPENHVHHSSSSNYVDGRNFFDIPASNIRGLHKRKRPQVPPVGEMGSTNRYCSRGSSSGASSSADPQQERLNTHVKRTRWEPMGSTQTFASHHHSSEAESSGRNVRSRSSSDLGCDVLGMNHPGIHPNQTNRNSHHRNHSVDHSRQELSAPLPEWNPIVLPAVPPVQTTGPDSSTPSLEMAQFFNGNGVSNLSFPGGGYIHNPPSTRNHGVAQNVVASRAHSTRGARSSYVHRSNPVRASLGSSRVGLAAPPVGCPQHIRSVGGDRWRFGDRSGRPRFSAERYRSPSVDFYGYDRFASEALMIAERAAFYDSRHLLDQHRDMRLDIDSMSYEELLALGERIGSVNTGVPDGAFPKCLIEMLCFSPETVEGNRCSICLEDYINMDQLAKVKACGHCFHGDCIKKWLSIKNLCPICKVAALPDEK